MAFNKTDDINYRNEDNLNSNSFNYEEKSNEKSRSVNKLKKEMSATETDNNKQYTFQIENSYNNIAQEEIVESIEESPLVLSIKESIFGPNYFARIYWKDVEEYLQNGGDPDDF